MCSALDATPVFTVREAISPNRTVPFRWRSHGQLCSHIVERGLGTANQPLINSSVYRFQFQILDRGSIILIYLEFRYEAPLYEQNGMHVGPVIGNSIAVGITRRDQGTVCDLN